MFENERQKAISWGQRGLLWLLETQIATLELLQFLHLCAPPLLPLPQPSLHSSFPHAFLPVSAASASLTLLKSYSPLIRPPPSPLSCS